MSKVMSEVIHGQQGTQQGTQQKTQPGVSQSFPPPFRRPTFPIRRSETHISSTTSSSSSQALPSFWTRTQTALKSTVLNVKTLFGVRRQEPLDDSSSVSDLESQLPQITEKGNRASSEAVTDTQSPERPALKQQDNATKPSPKVEVQPPVDNTERSNHPVPAQHPKSNETSQKAEEKIASPAEPLPEDSQRKKPDTDNAEDNESNRSPDPAEPADQNDQLPAPNRPPPVQPTPQQAKLPKIEPPDQNLHDYLLRGYYEPGTTKYQPRRTLDQYIYADFEATSHRDDDQVVYRYTKSGTHFVPKMFMVDQLWLWILGKGT